MSDGFEEELRRMDEDLGRSLARGDGAVAVTSERLWRLAPGLLAPTSADEDAVLAHLEAARNFARERRDLPRGALWDFCIRATGVRNREALDGTWSAPIWRGEVKTRAQAIAARTGCVSHQTTCLAGSVAAEAYDRFIQASRMPFHIVMGRVFSPVEFVVVGEGDNAAQASRDSAGLAINGKE